MERMDIEQITRKLEASFHPYRCVVKIEDYDNLIWLHIFNQNGESIIRTPKVAIDEINDESLLSSLIEQTKEALETEG